MLNEHKILLPLLLAGIIILPAGILKTGPQAGKKNDLDIMFYNAENFFDTIDSDLDDDEFLPLSPRRWDSYKYYRKLRNVYKVILLCGRDMSSPDIIGMCEVENEKVLKDLCERTYLYRGKYDYIISSGKDERGINTALLFKKDMLQLISSASWCPVNDDGAYIATRAALYSRLKSGNDTLDIIVCHWPSRRGGAIESENMRKRVASFIREKVDSLGKERKIIIMGDLNDEPGSDSVYKILQAVREGEDRSNDALVNTVFGYENGEGSYKYQGTWYLFDQVILSSSLYREEGGFCYEKQSFRIVNEDALLTGDTSYKGLRPYGTWWGYEYTGGFSDHLPVTIRLVRR
ncbi:MAG: hypothetical protein JW965_02040 [Bacteroidales bacterium]|nr:hypothetical protein [Bacteroidales bacterium]